MDLGFLITFGCFLIAIFSEIAILRFVYGKKYSFIWNKGSIQLHLTIVILSFLFMVIVLSTPKSTMKTFARTETITNDSEQVIEIYDSKFYIEPKSTVTIKVIKEDYPGFLRDNTKYFIVK